MKSLIKFNGKTTKAIKDFFIVKNQYSIGKDLITVGGDTDKYAIIDPESKSISLFNKVNEEKIKAVKVDLMTINITDAFLRFFYDFISNNENFSVTTFTINQDSFLNITAYSSLGLNKNTYYTENWHKLVVCGNPITEELCIPMNHPPVLPDDNMLHGSCALAIMELNYYFCEIGAKHSRDMFAEMSIYTSKMLDEFLFASPLTLTKHFAGENLCDAILQEFVKPEFNKTIKKVIKDNEDLTVIGILAQNGDTVWVPITMMLEYMDMTEEIFNMCLDKIKDKKVIASHSIIGLDGFLSTEVKYMKMYLEKANFFYNFDNILRFKCPSYNEDKKQYEELADYGLNF